MKRHAILFYGEQKVRGIDFRIEPGVPWNREDPTAARIRARPSHVTPWRGAVGPILLRTIHAEAPVVPLAMVNASAMERSLAEYDRF